MYSHCVDGGWILGYMIDGVQAEYVRIPHADNSLHRIPENIDDEIAVLLSDILSTGHEIGIQYGNVRPGDDIAIIGAGPIGMSALLTAQFYSPSKIIMVDLNDNRLGLAKELGATHTINSGTTNVEEAIKKIVGEEGLDVAIEAVGISPTWDICQKIVKPGAHIANVRVHDEQVDFEIEKLWIKNLTITTGLVNTNTTPMLLKTVSVNRMDLKKMITHHFPLSELEHAYQVLLNGAEEKAMKIIINNE